MSLLRPRPRDRRQLDPFLRVPETRPVPRFEHPRGVARDEVLAGILARAEADQRAAVLADEYRNWYGWTPPPPPPPARRPVTPRPYVPRPDFLLADLAALPGFRATVHAAYAAAVPAAALFIGGTWQARLAAAYKQHTGNVTIPGYGTEVPR